jgi:hypothetical protein
MYAVYLGRALQTVNPPNASVGNSQTAPTIITGQTAETSIATDDLILLSDTSASGALRKMTRANFVAGVGGTNAPCFQAYQSASQAINNSTFTTITFNNDSGSTGAIIGFDEGGCYNDTGSTVTLNGISTPAYSFAPNVAGKYRLTSFFTIDAIDNAATLFLGRILKNASTSDGILAYYWMKDPQAETERQGIAMTAIVEANGSSDYFTVQGYCETSGSQSNIFGTNNFSSFQGERLIL